MTKMVRNPIDAFVGSKIKLRRAVVGMSQTELATRLGITFQQVQKYEKGANRVGASRLYLISVILDVPVQSFFEGVGEFMDENTGAFKGTKDITVDKYESFIRSPSGIELCKAFVSIEDPVVRKRVMALVRSVAGEDIGADGATTADTAESVEA